jgi:N4-(beta-N-acetylglucosaminyl)-L-asparaginase
MVNRRDFVKRSLLGVVTGYLSSFKVNAGIANYSAEGIRPIVVATWDNHKATIAGMKMLKDGGTALDAAEAGAKVPEADPNDQSVGYGGLPDRDGYVTLDACVMDEKGNAGSVTFLQHIKHPVSVARKVMEDTTHVILSGKGALEFALANGFSKENLLTEAAEKEWKKWIENNNYNPINHDTIGILSLDENGVMAGACTTSGLAFKMHGRVGDSPIIGAGLYVDNEVGGACATGTGELVLKTLGTYLIVELMRQGRTPDEACEEGIDRILKKFPELKKGGTQVGYVALSMNGVVGGYSIEKDFSIAISEKNKDHLYIPGYKLK